jgi:hypothetical protein
MRHIPNEFRKLVWEVCSVNWPEDHSLSFAALCLYLVLGVKCIRPSASSTTTNLAGMCQVNSVLCVSCKEACYGSIFALMRRVDLDRDRQGFARGLPVPKQFQKRWLGSFVSPADGSSTAQMPSLGSQYAVSRRLPPCQRLGDPETIVHPVAALRPERNFL